MPGWAWAALIVLFTGAIGVWVSPATSLSGLRWLVLAIGLAIYAGTRLAMHSRRLFWLLFGLLTPLGLAVSAIGLTGSLWLTYKLPLTEQVVDWLPRLPAAVLALADAPAGLHPNPVSEVLNLLLMPLLGVLLFSAGGRAWPMGRALWAAAILTIALAGVYLLLAVSRSALAAFAAALVFLLWLRSPRLGGLAAGACLLALLIVVWRRDTLAETLIFSDLLTPHTYPGSSRLDIWRAALNLSARQPLTGVGLGAFPVITVAMGLGAPELISHAHNLVLQAALDLGWPGALAYLWLLLDAARGAVRAGRELRGGAHAGAAYGLAAALLTFFIFGLVDTITVTARAGWVVWFVMGLAAGARRLALTAGTVKFVGKADSSLRSE